jgi:hypothetical protein
MSEVFYPLSLGERVGVREMAQESGLEAPHRPSPLAPPPRGEGNKSFSLRSAPCH